MTYMSKFQLLLGWKSNEIEVIFMAECCLKNETAL